MKTTFKILTLLFFSMSFGTALSQSETGIYQDVSISTFVDGTLIIPTTEAPVPLAIIIPDSGPTDRNGNQNFQKSNSLKKLAEGLRVQNIASFRYDKRILKQLKKGFVDPNISFDDFITDALAVVNYFKNSESFSEIYIIGHGQGSLVGMLAAKEPVNGFISLAGSGTSIDQVIIDQVSKMDQALVKDTEAAFSEMRAGRTVNSYPRALESIFGRETQPFIMSWMKYDPKVIMADLTIPSLIINGTKDLQVSVEEARSLEQSTTNSTLVVIENMNHVLCIIEGDELENSKSYNESFRPIADEVIQHISEFIRSN